MSRRIVVLGGTGLFGGAAVELLRAEGMAPLVAARRAARGRGGPPDLRLDAEDPAALRASLRPGDIVLDAAGPFQERSAALVEAALDVGCDVIDLSDSLGHFLRIDALRPQIERKGIRVLTGCSSVTTLLAALVRASGVKEPARVSVYLAPASRVTVTAGTGGALRHSLGRPIRILRGGRLVPARGWRESRPFLMPQPIGRARGHLMESAHAATLPRIYPTLRDADFWVDSRVPGLNAVFRLLARAPALAAPVCRAMRRSTWVARTLGSVAGGMLAEIEGASGAVSQARVFAPRRSYLAAVAPAVLAVRALASGRFPERGLVPHDRHVDPDELFTYLRRLGIEYAFSGPHSQASPGFPGGTGQPEPQDARGPRFESRGQWKGAGKGENGHVGLPTGTRRRSIVRRHKRMKGGTFRLGIRPVRIGEPLNSQGDPVEKTPKESERSSPLTREEEWDRPFADLDNLRNSRRKEEVK